MAHAKTILDLPGKRVSHRRRVVLTLLALVCSLAVVGQALADEASTGDNTKVAEQLLANTVTVRSQAEVPRNALLNQAQQAQSAPPAPVPPLAPQPSQQNATPPDANPAPANRARVLITPNIARALANVAEVTVGSGVALDKGLIVTVIASRQPSRVRITLPDGTQAEAEPRVFDVYTGLCLMEAVKADLPGFQLATETPRIGEPVLTAAASGIEGALVSQGVLSAVDRFVDSELPPLLQTDVRTTETSHGAGLVDRNGRLIGILVTTEKGDERTGWAYALPAWHVERLVRAYEPNSIVVLEQQRTSLGVVLATDRDGLGVRVANVLDDSPAQQAGLQNGDLLRAIGDIKVRHPYQVVAQILKHLPGEKVSVTYERDGESSTTEATLAADVRSNRVAEEPAPDQQGQLRKLGPQLKVQRIAPNQFEIRNSRRAGNQNATPQAPASGEEEDLPSKLAELEQTVRTLNEELSRRARAQAEDQSRLRSLTEEVERLRQRLAEELPEEK